MTSITGEQDAAEAYYDTHVIGKLAGYVDVNRRVEQAWQTILKWAPREPHRILNQLLLIARHYDRRLARKWFWPILTGQLLWGALALRHGTALAWLQGKRDGFRQFYWSTQPSHDIQRVIEASEAEIRRRASDFYWDCYFGLNGVL